jgi:hypothetical protein
VLVTQLHVFTDRGATRSQKCGFRIDVSIPQTLCTIEEQIAIPGSTRPRVSVFGSESNKVDTCIWWYVYACAGNDKAVISHH